MHDQKGLVGQFGDRDGFLGGERVVAGERERMLLGEQLHELQSLGNGGWRQKKADIQCAAPQALDLAIGRQDGQLELDLRIVPAVLRHDDRGHSGERAPERQADADDAQLAAAGPPADSDRPVRLREREAGLLEEDRAGRSERDGTRSARQQPGAQRGFERLYLRAQGWLRDAQSIGRASEMQLLGERHEVAELAQFH